MRFAFLSLVLLLSMGVPALRADEPAEAKVEPAEVRLVEGYNGDAAEASGRPSRRMRRKGAGPDVGIRLKFDRALDVFSVRYAFSIDPVVAIDWDGAWQEGTNIVRVPAAVKPGQKYEISITEVPSGGKEVQRISTGKHSFVVPGGPPTLQFSQLGGVIERRSRQFVHVILRNTEMIRMEATSVPLIALIPNQPELPTTSPIDIAEKRWAERGAEVKAVAKGPFAGLFDATSKTEKEVFPVPGSRDRDRRESVPLAWRPTKAGGTYLVRAVSLDKGEPGFTNAEVLQITDLSLSWKVANNELLVWTTTLGSGEVVPKARIFVGTSDGKLIAAGETDADGVLRIKAEENKPVLDLSQKGAPMQDAPFSLEGASRVYAMTAEDLSWGNIAEQRVTVASRIPQEEKDELAVRAHAFTERGVYRPGDTVRFKATLRAFKDGKAAPPEGSGTREPSYLATVTDPKGRKSREVKLTLSPFGTAWGTLSTRGSDPLGEYTLDIKSLDGKQTLGNTTYRVEEFLPPRHKVEVSFKEKDVEVDEGNGPKKKRRVLEGIIKGVYYAGGPVKHGKVRWRVELAASRHDTGLKGYVAGSDMQGGPSLLESGEAMLDATGGVVVEIPLSAEVLDGRRSLSISATVLDFDARAASGTGTFTVTPTMMVGISSHEASVDNGADVDLTAVVVDREGKKIESGDLTVTVLEENWTNVQKRNEDGDFFWSSEPVMVRAYEQSAKLVNGVAPINVRFTRGGAQQVQIAWKSSEGQTYRSTTSFDVSWSDSDSEGDNWQAEKLRRVGLTSDRTEYVPGETARLRIRTPRQPVSMLMTVERDNVLAVKRITLKPGESFIEVPIDAAFAPNVYVSVMASHAREAFPLYAAEADTLAPAYSVGYVSLPVRPTHTELKIAITGAGPEAKATPRARHTVSLSVKDASGKPVVAEVALAVVDESILALTDYKTPTLQKLFEILLPLGVKTSDLRNALSLQTPFKSFTVRPLTGGDGGNGQNRAREWFDPVAFYQPDLVTDENGEAKVEFTLPDSMTTYRVFAVAIDKGDNHGSAAAPLLVRKPFYLEAGMPRFFTVGDKGKFSVMVFNGTANAGEVELDVKSSGGLTVKVPAAKTALAANDRARVPVEFEGVTAGHVKLEITAKMGSDSDTVVLPVPVRSRYVRRTQAVDGALDASSRQSKLSLKLPPDVSQLPDKEAHEAVATLSVSSLSALRLLGGLESLMHYPYGCIEQTSSGLLPLAALRELIAKNLVPKFTLAQADFYIKPALDRIFSMQTQDGGFGYWPGNTVEHPWGSAYATLALVWAKNAGYDVPEAELNRALGYLERLVTGKDAEGKPVAVSSLASEGRKKAEALAQFALAAAGRAQDPSADLKETGLTREDAYLLCIALARSNNPDAKKELARVSTRKDPTAFDYWTFYSPVRAKAIELLANVEVDPKAARVTQLMAELYKALKPNGSWYSTQDNAWCVTALGRAQAANPPGSQPIKGEIKSEGSTPSAFSLKGTETTTHVATFDAPAFLKSPAVEVTKTGGAALFYRLECSYPWRGPDAGTKGQPVERTYKRMAGEGKIRVGDLVEVQVTMHVDSEMAYVAVADPLPAGLVAINSALASEGKVPPTSADQQNGWDEGGVWSYTFDPDHIELRDDHVQAFRNRVWRGTYRFNYVARAVCEGTFVVPPVKIEPMYQPENAIFSSETGLTIEGTAP